MSRWVLPQQAELKLTSADGDKPLDRVVKYVPAEVITAYTLLFTALVTSGLAERVAQPAAAGLIALFLVVTIIYILRQAPQGTVRQAHLIVSPISFLAWAYPISSALLGDWFIPLLSFAAQAVVIALAMIIVPQEGS